MNQGIKRIREGAFYGHADAIYFEGTEKQWKSVVIEEFDNNVLKGVNVHCNYNPSVLVTPKVSVINEIDCARIEWDCVPDAVRYVVFKRAAGSSVWEKIYESEVGETYDSVVKSIMPYGAFVEFMPGKEGLLHISEISWARIEDMEKAGLKEGDHIDVKLLEIDKKTGKFKLSHKVLTPRPPRPAKPEAKAEEKPAE